MWVPAPRAAPVTSAAKAVGPAVGREGAERGRESSHLSSLGHSKFKRIPLKLGGSRRLGLPVLPGTALCPLTLPVLVSGCPSFCLFLLQALPVCLCLFISVYVRVSLFLIILAVSVCLFLCSSLPGFVLLHLFLCLSVLVTPLYISLPRWISLQMPLCHCLYLCLPPPIPWLAASGWVVGGCCSSPMRQPRDNSGHCLGPPSRSLPHARHLAAASVFPLKLWGMEGAPRREDSAQHLLWISGSPDPLCLY